MIKIVIPAIALSFEITATILLLRAVQGQEERIVAIAAILLAMATGMMLGFLLGTFASRKAPVITPVKDSKQDMIALQQISALAKIAAILGSTGEVEAPAADGLKVNPATKFDLVDDE